MTYLPVPPLAQTLARFEEYVRPLLTAEEVARTAQVVERFAEHDGPAAQEVLERQAAEQNETGASWLTELWFAAYLGGRTPLTLTSNVGFELTWPERDSGVERAAGLAHRLARVHLDHLRGEIEPLVSPRGESLCMQQWSYLAGGIRRPRAGQDEIVAGSADPSRREILVMRAGRAYAVPISDDTGRVVPLATLRDALEAVLTDTDDAPVDAQASRLPFSAWSYLGSDRAAEYEAEILTDPHNAEVYDRLVHALFVLALVDESDAPEDHLRDTAFAYGLTWPYKPVTYVPCLVDDFVGMHIEHTVADGGTLQSVIARAQDLDDLPDDSASDDSPGDTSRPADGGPSAVAPERLTWRLTDDVRGSIAADVAEYVAAAERCRVRVVRVPATTSDTLRLSTDAMQQFVILYAQLRAYGRVRSTYESVDMREYQAGRTETMRPVTPQAVALARALLDGDATPAHLHDALAAHKRRIVECKKGDGIDRHLLGLRIESAELGASPELFEDAGYRRLTTDFLSTTSLGADGQIARYAFAPTSEGGIGIGYSRRGDGAEFEFVLNHEAAREGDIEDFARALGEGASRLAALVADAS